MGEAWILKDDRSEAVRGDSVVRIVNTGTQILVWLQGDNNGEPACVAQAREIPQGLDVALVSAMDLVRSRAGVWFIYQNGDEFLPYWFVEPMGKYLHHNGLDTAVRESPGV